MNPPEGGGLNPLWGERVHGRRRLLGDTSVLPPSARRRAFQADLSAVKQRCVNTCVAPRRQMGARTGAVPSYFFFFFLLFFLFFEILCACEISCQLFF